MKKAFSFTISSMMIMVGFFGTFCAIGNELLFSTIGIILASLVCLTFIGGWICLMIILFSATRATIATGKGIGFLFQTLLDRVNKKGENA